MPRRASSRESPARSRLDTSAVCHVAPLAARKQRCSITPSSRPDSAPGTPHSASPVAATGNSSGAHRAGWENDVRTFAAIGSLQLDRVTAPVLVLHGDADTEVDVDDQVCLDGADYDALIPLKGCLLDDGDFDGVSYQRDWPGNLRNPGQDRKLHGTPVQLTVPSTRGHTLEQVAFETDLSQATRVIKAAADEVWHDEVVGPSVLEEPEIWGVEGFGPTGIAIRLVVKTQPSDQWKVLRELRSRIKEALEREGIGFGFQRIPWPGSDVVPGPTPPPPPG